MNQIQSNEDVAVVLKEMGYSPEIGPNSVSFVIGDPGSGFPVVMTMTDEDLTITCKVALWQEIAEKINIADEEDFFFGILDLNTQILPYSFGIISNLDGESDDRSTWPLVLIDSIPTGDISEGELKRAVEGLLSALYTAKPLFTAVLS